MVNSSLIFVISFKGIFFLNQSFAFGSISGFLCFHRTLSIQTNIFAKMVYLGHRWIYSTDLVTSPLLQFEPQSSNLAPASSQLPGMCNCCCPIVVFSFLIEGARLNRLDSIFTIEHPINSALIVTSCEYEPSDLLI